MPKGPLTVRLARWSATHPWRAIGLWTVFVIACLVVGTAAGTKEYDDSGPGEAGRAERIVNGATFQTAGEEKGPAENVLITAGAAGFDRGKADAAAAAVATRMKALPEVAGVEEPIPSDKGDALLVPVRLAAHDDGAGEAALPKLFETTAAVQRDFPALRVEEVGNLSINKALDDTLGKDLKRAELFSVPVTLLILLIASGALIAAGIPLLLALSAVVAAFGLSSLASHLLPAGGEVGAIITLLIGLAVGVDYSLFYLRREREERARGRDHVNAVEIAAATSGHAVVVSGIAVIIAMAGLYLVGDVVFSTLASGAILVVAVAVIGSLTVLPAILAKLGRWVDRPRIPFLWRLTTPRADRQPRLWPFLLRPALKHPLITFVISVGALIALAIPAFDMKLKFPSDDDLPRTTPVMQAYDRLTASYPGSGTSHMIAVKAPADKADEVKAALASLSARTKGNPLFATDSRLEPEVSTDRTVTQMSIPTPYESRSDEAVRSLEALRDMMPATVGTVAGAEYAVGGEVAGSEDFAALIIRKLPLVAGVVVLLTFIVMVMTFRSVVVALTAVLLNVLSAGAAYGLLQVVFGGGLVEDLFGVRSMNAIVSWLPMFLFVVLFGLSMDYHVFVVSRIREAYLRGMSTREAVAAGITRSAGVVTSAAIIMVAVFAIFGTLSTIDMKQLGVGLGAAILIDATIIRAVVLPSLMTLLGNANWWAPRFIRRRAPQPEPVPTGELVAATR